MAHALTARRLGIDVREITLWLFGGVSKLEGEPRRARDEALITGAGPATSLVCAGLAQGASMGLAASGTASLAADLLGWLALLNVALAVFNLIPLFPLDGGRLLTSFLWSRGGSRDRAVMRSAAVGRVFALLLMGVGAVEVFLGDLTGGLWLVFMAWFLMSAGAAEAAAVGVRALLRGVPVSAVMSAPVASVPEWLTLEQFLVWTAQAQNPGLCAVHDPAGHMTGLVRVEDVMRVPPARRQTERLRDTARPASLFPSAAPADDLGEVLQRGGDALDRRLLVFEGPNLVGVVTPGDVMRVLHVRRSGLGRPLPA
jgi:Zn-dependent protease